ncbi:hypothetical protein LRR18_16310 [Mangrovimonas sp. AS39]|uniref:hypothetical protein n=1 Tax=Mangrovimonas futianensis TaxID=2895523 RepID=UPI001E4F5EE1|nr:hypothetical protein [Mangrovimonas futianensis]MCF1193153.1 hypothetical protein [Mangrovimonas futianensis]
MKRSKKVVSLSEHNSMMDMLKVLYGNDEVKDDSTKKAKGAQEVHGSKRETGTDMVSEVDKSQLQAKEVCHQDEQ